MNDKSDSSSEENLFFPKNHDPKVYKPRKYRKRKIIKTKSHSDSELHFRSTRLRPLKEQHVKKVTFKNSIRVISQTGEVYNTIPLPKNKIPKKKTSRDVNTQFPENENSPETESNGTRNKRRADADHSDDMPPKRIAQNLIDSLYEMKPDRPSNVIEKTQYIKYPSWYQCLLLQQVKEEESCSSCEAASLPEIRLSAFDRLTEDPNASTSPGHQYQSSTSSEHQCDSSTSTDEQQNLLPSSTPTSATTISEDSCEPCSNNSSTSIQLSADKSDPSFSSFVDIADLDLTSVSEESSSIAVAESISSADDYVLNSASDTIRKLFENISLKDESMFTNWQQIAHALTSPGNSDLSDSCSSCRTDDSFSTVTPVSSEENTRYSFSGKNNVESKENGSNETNSQGINYNSTEVLVYRNRQHDNIVANTKCAKKIKKPPVPQKTQFNISPVNTSSQGINSKSTEALGYRDSKHDNIVANTKSAKKVKKQTVPPKTQINIVTNAKSAKKVKKLPVPQKTQINIVTNTKSDKKVKNLPVPQKTQINIVTNTKSDKKVKNLPVPQKTQINIVANTKSAKNVKKPPVPQKNQNNIVANTKSKNVKKPPVPQKSQNNIVTNTKSAKNVKKPPVPQKSQNNIVTNTKSVKNVKKPPVPQKTQNNIVTNTKSAKNVKNPSVPQKTQNNIVTNTKSAKNVKNPSVPQKPQNNIVTNTKSAKKVKKPPVPQKTQNNISSVDTNSQGINSNSTETLGYRNRQHDNIVANTKSAKKVKNLPVAQKTQNNISSVDTNSQGINDGLKQDTSYRGKIIPVNTNSAKELKEPGCPQKIKIIDISLKSNSQEKLKIPGPVTRSARKSKKSTQLNSPPNTKKSSPKSVTSLQNPKNGRRSLVKNERVRRCTRNLRCTKNHSSLKRRFDNIMKPIKAMNMISNFVVSANGYNGIIKCPQNRCFFKHVNHKAIIEHFQYRHPNNHGLLLFSCTECRQKYSSKFILDLHINHEHPRINRCPMCFKFFSDFKHLENHGFQHKYNKFYECETCLRQFASAVGLRYHLTREKECPSFHAVQSKKKGIIFSRKSYNY